MMQKAGRVILYNPSSQYKELGPRFGLFFSICPFDGSWLISPGLAICQTDGEPKEPESGVSVAFEELTFKTARLPKAGELRIAAAF